MFTNEIAQWILMVELKNALERKYEKLKKALEYKSFFKVEDAMERIYSHMGILGVIDKKKLIQAAYDRSLHYDIRLIIESKHINKAAFKFLDLLRGEIENE